MNSNLSIYVASHKKIDFDLPQGYSVMQVNCHNNTKWDGYLHDDEGVNISLKNPSFCELTVLYSLWKNNNSNIKGLAHYRRYLSRKYKTFFGIYKRVDALVIKESILSAEEIEDILKDYDIIMPHKKCPYPLNAVEDLQRYCFLNDIKILYDVIDMYYHDYKESLMEVLSSYHISYCNMIIAKKEKFDALCEWLFGVLFDVEKKIDIDSYDTQHKRIFGYFAEVLVNVYCLKNNLEEKNLPIIMSTEKKGGIAAFTEVWTHDFPDLLKWNKTLTIFSEFRFRYWRHEEFKSLERGERLIHSTNSNNLLAVVKKHLYDIGYNRIRDYLVGDKISVVTGEYKSGIRMCYLVIEEDDLNMVSEQLIEESRSSIKRNWGLNSYDYVLRVVVNNADKILAKKFFDNHLIMVCDKTDLNGVCG